MWRQKETTYWGQRQEQRNEDREERVLEKMGRAFGEVLIREDPLNPIEENEKERIKDIEETYLGRWSSARARKG